jgi:Na+-transporting NADH:ubiquinone oxidoreductase subunit NqrB
MVLVSTRTGVISGKELLGTGGRNILNATGRTFLCSGWLLWCLEKGNGCMV